MRSFITRLLSNESGATAIEYALLASGIGIVILTGIGGVAVALNRGFAAVSNSL